MEGGTRRVRGGDERKGGRGRGKGTGEGERNGRGGSEEGGKERGRDRGKRDERTGKATEVALYPVPISISTFV